MSPRLKILAALTAATLAAGCGGAGVSSESQTKVSFSALTGEQQSWVRERRMTSTSSADTQVDVGLALLQFGGQYVDSYFATPFPKAELLARVLARPDFIQLEGHPVVPWQIRECTPAMLAAARNVRKDQITPGKPFEDALIAAPDIHSTCDVLIKANHLLFLPAINSRILSIRMSPADVSPDVQRALGVSDCPRDPFRWNPSCGSSVDVSPLLRRQLVNEIRFIDLLGARLARDLAGIGWEDPQAVAYAAIDRYLALPLDEILALRDEAAAWSGSIAVHPQQTDGVKFSTELGDFACETGGCVWQVGGSTRYGGGVFGGQRWTASVRTDRGLSMGQTIGGDTGTSSGASQENDNRARVGTP